MARTVTFKGKPIHLSGPELNPGDTLPDFRLTASDLSDISKSSLAGSVLVFSVVPSLDTPVCAMQTKRFNKEAGSMAKDVKIVTVSMDLPFAQTRWCEAEGVQNVITASDYKYRSFGENFGVYIQELGLLARSIFIADRDGVIRYVQFVPEISQEPDYEPVLTAIRGITA